MSLVRHTLTFEVLTPLFMGGPAQFFRDARAGDGEMRGDAAISIPGLVGRWRFWFRALAGGVMGPKTSPELAAAERKLFGGLSDDHGEASSFRVRLLPTENQLRRKSADVLTRNCPAMRYLAFGMGLRGGRQPAPARFAIEPGSDQTFGLEIVASADTWRRLSPIIDAATVFGGYGARSHRGLGSVHWKETDGQQRPCRCPDDVLRDAIGAVSDLERGKWDKGQAPYPIVSSDSSRFKDCGPYWPDPKAAVTSGHFDSWCDALLAVRRQLRVEHGEVNPDGTPIDPGFFGLGPRFGFRHRHPGPTVFVKSRTSRGRYPYVEAVDHAAAWASVPGPAGLKNPMFGLPLVYAQPHWDRTVNLVDGEVARRPSPVTFTVHRSEEGLRVIVVLFHSEFMPPGARVVMTKGVGHYPVSGLPDWTILDDFFDGCGGRLITF